MCHELRAQAGYANALATRATQDTLSEGVSTSEPPLPVAPTTQFLPRHVCMCSAMGLWSAPSTVRRDAGGPVAVVALHPGYHM